MKNATGKIRILINGVGCYRLQYQVKSGFFRREWFHHMTGPIVFQTANKDTLKAEYRRLEYLIKPIKKSDPDKWREVVPPWLFEIPKRR